MFRIGVDPGWKSCGYAIISSLDGTTWNLDRSGNVDPSSFSDIHVFINSLNLPRNSSVACIERYVPFNHSPNSESEKVNQVIGAFIYHFHELNFEKVLKFKSIEWKIALCQKLVLKKGFDNPGSKLDKKFSLAAAKACCGKSIINDHEADAICLAYLTTI